MTGGMLAVQKEVTGDGAEEEALQAEVTPGRQGQADVPALPDPEEWSHVPDVEHLLGFGVDPGAICRRLIHRGHLGVSPRTLARHLGGQGRPDLAAVMEAEYHRQHRVEQSAAAAVRKRVQRAAAGRRGRTGRGAEPPALTRGAAARRRAAS